MPSITLSVPEKTRELMKQFPHLNWSAFIRAAIESKAKELAWKQKMLDKFEQEQDLINWSVKLGRKAHRGRYEELKKQGWL